MTCNVEGCEGKVRAKGLCPMHYTRLKRHGDPLVSLHPRRPTAPEIEHGTPQAYNYRGCRCEVCREWRLAYNKAWQEANPEVSHAQFRRARLRSYGLLPEDYDRMLAAQGGGCAICGDQPHGVRNRYLHVDHDHETGVVRGLLCHRCNPGIGLFLDDPARLLAAADYLRAAQIEVAS